MKQPVLHIGMPKTGTTFLQTRLFKKSDKLLNLIYVSRADTPGYYGILDIVQKKDEPDLKMLRHEIYDHIAAHPDRVPILSWESLSQKSRHTSIEEKARRLKASFPNAAAVTITIREPISFSRSWYTQWLRSFVKRGHERRDGFRTYQGFMKQMRAGKDAPFIYQCETVATFEKYFDKINVLAYETLRVDPTAYLRAFFDPYSIDFTDDIDDMMQKSDVHASLTQAEVDFVEHFRSTHAGEDFVPTAMAFLERYGLSADLDEIAKDAEPIVGLFDALAED